MSKSIRKEYPDRVEWVNEAGYLHREDGPAYESFLVQKDKVYKEWWINGKRHRIDGPAIESTVMNYKEWWVNWFYIRIY
jgi:hypothetical protein